MIDRIAAATAAANSGRQVEDQKALISARVLLKESGDQFEARYRPRALKRVSEPTRELLAIRYNNVESLSPNDSRSRHLTKTYKLVTCGTKHSIIQTRIGEIARSR